MCVFGQQAVKHHHMLHAIHSKQNSDSKGEKLRLWLVEHAHDGPEYNHTKLLAFHYNVNVTEGHSSRGDSYSAKGTSRLSAWPNRLTCFCYEVYSEGQISLVYIAFSHFEMCGRSCKNLWVVSGRYRNVVYWLANHLQQLYYAPWLSLVQEQHGCPLLGLLPPPPVSSRRVFQILECYTSLPTRHAPPLGPFHQTHHWTPTFSAGSMESPGGGQFLSTCVQLHASILSILALGGCLALQKRECQWFLLWTWLDVISTCTC